MTTTEERLRAAGWEGPLHGLWLAPMRPGAVGRIGDENIGYTTEDALVILDRRRWPPRRSRHRAQ
jgi:hypothetical protein